MNETIREEAPKVASAAMLEKAVFGFDRKRTYQRERRGNDPALMCRLEGKYSRTRY